MTDAFAGHAHRALADHIDHIDHVANSAAHHHIGIGAALASPVSAR